MGWNTDHLIKWSRLLEGKKWMSMESTREIENQHLEHQANVGDSDENEMTIKPLLLYAMLYILIENYVKKLCEN